MVLNSVKKASTDVSERVGGVRASLERKSREDLSEEVTHEKQGVSTGSAVCQA